MVSEKSIFASLVAHVAFFLRANMLVPLICGSAFTYLLIYLDAMEVSPADWFLVDLRTGASGAEGNASGYTK